VRPGRDPAALATARTALFRAFRGEGPSGIPLALERLFEGRAYGIEAAFLDERRRLLARLGGARLSPEVPGPGEGGGVDGLLAALRAESPAQPALLQGAAALVERATRAELVALAADGAVGPRVDRIRALAATARSLGIPVPPDGMAAPIECALRKALARLRVDLTAEAVDDAMALLALGETLRASPGLWAAQTQAAGLWREAAPRDRGVLVPLMAALGFAPAVLAVPPVEG
jgi:hypothetical protein